jgi:hypothetical protein
VSLWQIGVEDDEIVRDDRIAVEAGVLIRSSVEFPLNRAGILVERVEDRARSDEQLVPNDRWGDGESTCGVVLPENLEPGCCLSLAGRNVGL